MKQTFHAELLEALGNTGCGLCRLGARTVARYLDILAYENVNDVALRATIREGLGLCNRHAWQFLNETRAPLGTAIISRDLIRTLQQRTPERVEPTDDLARRLQGLLPRRPCVACAALAVSIKDCAHQFLQSWSEAPFRAAFDASEGLCWPHLLATFDADRFARRWHDVLAAQRGAWDRRIARARQEQSAAPLLEALSGAPRLNGAQIEPKNGGTVTDPNSVPCQGPAIPDGWCSVCASVEAWLGSRSLSPAPPPPVRGGEGEKAGLLCAVHAWHQGRVQLSNNLTELVDSIHLLDERLAQNVHADTTGSTVVRVAERIRRGSSLPPKVTFGLECPLCPEQVGYEAGIARRLEPTTLCVPHLRVAAHHNASFGGILKETRRTWRTIEGQLDEVIRKYDYRFNREPRGEEQTSPRWAVALVAGTEGVR